MGRAGFRRGLEVPGKKCRQAGTAAGRPALLGPGDSEFSHFLRKVERFTPRRAAALLGPATTQLVRAPLVRARLLRLLLLLRHVRSLPTAARRPPGPPRPAGPRSIIIILAIHNWLNVGRCRPGEAPSRLAHLSGARRRARPGGRTAYPAGLTPVRSVRRVVVIRPGGEAVECSCIELVGSSRGCSLSQVAAAR
jgi:hypothetical protein